MKQRRKEFYL